jgi:AAA+ superfamily predicted ATPase
MKIINLIIASLLLFNHVFSISGFNDNLQQWFPENQVNGQTKELIEEEVSKQVKIVVDGLNQQIDRLYDRLKFDFTMNCSNQGQNFEKFPYIPESSCVKKNNNYDIDLLKEVLISCPEKLKVIIELMSEKNSTDDFFEIFIPHNIVLLGPPGVGKSLLAESIALYCNIPYTFIKGTVLANEYVNSGANNLNRIFSPILARDEPHIIIIDELQTIIKKCNGRDIDIGTAEALWLLLDESKTKKNIFVIATANDLTSLPPQLKSRLSKNIYEIKLPNLRARERVITYYISKFKFSYLIKPGAIKEIAKKTYGFSVRDLESLVDVALSHVLSNFVRKHVIDFTIKDLYFGLYHIKKRQSNLYFPEWIYKTLEYILPTIIVPFALSLTSLLINNYLTYNYNQNSLKMNELHYQEIMNKSNGNCLEYNRR